MDRDVSSLNLGGTTNPVYEAAEQYVTMGISVVPIKTGTKEPPVGFRWGEYVERIATADERYEWFVVQGHQVAIVAGDIVPLDFDSPDGFESMAKAYPAIRDLPRVRTGSGTHHVWVRPAASTAKYNTTTPNGGRLEVRAGRHYTLAPPSIHPNGQHYAWEVEPPVDGIPTVALESIGLRTVPPNVRQQGDPLDTEGTSLTLAEIDSIIRIVELHWIPYARHDICLYLAGWLAGHSVPEDDVVQIILSLAEQHGDDNRAHEFKRTIRDTYRKARSGEAVGGWSKLNDPQAPLISQSAASELDLLMRGRNPVLTFEKDALYQPGHPYIISITDLLDELDEPERWLVEHVWRDETIGLLVGPPKTLKSLSAIEMAVAIASGTPMFGLYHVPEPATVVYIQEESARRYVRKRFAGILAGRGIHPTAVKDTLFTITNQRFRLDEADQIQRLVTDVIEVYRPSLIILDPLREMHWQDENKAEAMMPMLRVLKDLRDTYGVSIAIVHHNNKNPEYTNPADSIRGSGAIWAAMDAGVFIARTSDDNQMKVSVVLKEGGQIDPFLFSLESDGEGITFQVIQVENAKRSISDAEIVQQVSKLKDWSGIKELVEICSLSGRRLQPRLNALAARGEIEKKTGKSGKLLYGPLGIDDEPTF